MASQAFLRKALKKAALIAAIVGVLYFAGSKLAEALRPVYGVAGAVGAWLAVFAAAIILAYVLLRKLTKSHLKKRRRHSRTVMPLL